MTLWNWKGINEVREIPQSSGSESRLLLRDAITLDARSTTTEQGWTLADKTDGLGIFGTLIIYGPTFQKLADFFMLEFAHQPRIGGRTWASDVTLRDVTQDQKDKESREKRAKADGLLWTAANTRGFVLVKFGAREVSGARSWLSDMLSLDGSVHRQFGQQALFSLR